MKTLSLNTNWTFQDEAAAVVTSPLATTLPSTIHMDLLRHGLIPDPFHGLNERKLKWIPDTVWVYRRSFDADEAFRAFEKKLLCFQGIDTFARIELNGVELGTTDNCFHPYTYDIGHLLQEHNTLTVTLASPTKTLAKLRRTHGHLFAPFDKAPVCTYGRKPQYSFGWDWGPNFPTSGIWQDVSLIGFNAARITGVFARQRTVAPERAALEVEVELEVTSFAKDDYEVTVELGDGARTVTQTLSRRLNDGLNVVSLPVVIDTPRLWYPVGHGEAFLHTLTTIVRLRGAEVCRHTERIGLRSVEIEQQRDAEGRTFIIKVNGNRVFGKGMNWIPADSFLDRADAAKYRRSLAQFADANMNMIRVWGGGIYESDLFYDICDERGILVWQDFMSACQEIPDHLSWFRHQMTEEAVYQIKRLRNRASLVVWCGNNENEGIRYNGWSSAPKRDTFHGEYTYHTLLPDLCHHYDPTRPYVPTCPYGDERRYNTRETGDYHSYEGWGSGDWHDFLGVKARFVSEIGYQSCPDIETFEQFAEPGELAKRSRVVLAHEKTQPSATWAIERMEIGIERCLGYPKNNDFRRFVYLSQVNWAEGARRCIEGWRARTFDTAGILFWQFNDCWPVISWSFVDYYMRPKLCYYALKQAFKPIIATYTEAAGSLVVSVINETLTGRDVTLRVRRFGMKAEIALVRMVEAKVMTNGAQQVCSIPIGELGLANPRREYIVIDCLVDGQRVHRNYYFADKFAALELGKPSLAVSATRVGERAADIRLVADCLAPALKLSAAAAYDYSDNYLFLLPGEEACVRLTSDQPLPEALTLDVQALNMIESRVLSL
jgi:beta-mannosidase